MYGWRALGLALGIYTPLTEFESTFKAVATQMTGSVTSLAFFAVAYHVFTHFRLRQAAQQLRIEKQAAELNYLKAQTNPHFLFNTLNNIYALTLAKSDLAPESLLRLSKILRFMLYETGGAYIAVGQELQVLEDYIALERLRYDDSLRIGLRTDIEDPRQALPPLLLVPLVENAFKHGISETRGKAFIDIQLSIRGRRLFFEVRNSSEAADSEAVVDNIGLSNLRRQLELLYTDYSVSVRQKDAVFSAVLHINLESHV
ncbi:MAG: histidine kinase, partial [Sphingobacteriales bacterium]